MAIGRDYMPKKTCGPSGPKVFLDTQIIPSVVNTAGRLEVALDRASVRTGLRPAVVLTGLLGLTALILIGLVRRTQA